MVIGAQLFCGMASVTANSRMIYAFSRDGALPFSNVWHTVSPRTRTPVAAVWLAAAGALVLGLPYLINVTAYAAVTSIAVIGLYIAYVIPTLLRLGKGEAFQRGPWHLGRWSKLIGTVSVVWVIVITVLFMLPQVSPVTWESFNYAPVAVLVVLGFAAAWWKASARHWFLNLEHARTKARGSGAGGGARTGRSVTLHNTPDQSVPCPVPVLPSGAAVSPIPDRRHGHLPLCSGRQHRGDP